MSPQPSADHHHAQPGERDGQPQQAGVHQGLRIARRAADVPRSGDADRRVAACARAGAGLGGRRGSQVPAIGGRQRRGRRQIRSGGAGFARRRRRRPYGGCGGAGRRGTTGGRNGTGGSPTRTWQASLPGRHGGTCRAGRGELAGRGARRRKRGWQSGRCRQVLLNRFRDGVRYDGCDGPGGQQAAQSSDGRPTAGPRRVLRDDDDPPGSEILIASGYDMSGE